MSSLSSSGGIPGIDTRPTVRHVSPGDPDKRREQREKREKAKPHEDQVELHEDVEAQPTTSEHMPTIELPADPPSDEHVHIDVRG
jgi:hypothetical protein